MLITIRALNNITAHKLLYFYYIVLFDNDHYQTMNNFNMLIVQKDHKNIFLITTLIFVVIRMHIEPIRLLEKMSP